MTMAQASPSRGTFHLKIVVIVGYKILRNTNGGDFEVIDDELNADATMYKDTYDN